MAPGGLPAADLLGGDPAAGYAEALATPESPAGRIGPAVPVAWVDPAMDDAAVPLARSRRARRHRPHTRQAFPARRLGTRHRDPRGLPRACEKPERPINAPYLPARGCRRAAADDQFRGDDGRVVRDGGVGDLAEEFPDAEAAHGREVLADGGKRGPERGGGAHVVEADDADVARDVAAELVHRPHCAEGHLVVGGEESGG